MFKKWKETRENKRLLIKYKAFLLGEIVGLIMKLKQSNQAIKESGISGKDVLEILDSIKGLDQNELLKVLADAMKTKEGE